MILENEYLKIDVNPHGGSLTSFFDKEKNEELLYQPDPRAWQGQDVVIFPFIGAIKDRKYTVEGKEYPEKNHGLIRYMDGDIEIKGNKLVVSFISSEETHKLYPWDFDLRIVYTLNKKTLRISYDIFNLSDEPLLFNVGGHPALKASGHDNKDEFVLEDTYLSFDKDYDTKRIILNEDGSLTNGSIDYKLSSKLNISKDMIREYKTLILDAKDINECLLNTNNREYRFKFHDASYLAVWSDHHFGNYICVEPWWGIPDSIDSPLELKNKNLLRTLNSHSEFTTGYEIEII